MRPQGPLVAPSVQMTTPIAGSNMSPRSKARHRDKSKRTKRPITSNQQKILHANCFGLRETKYVLRLTEEQLEYVQVNYDPYIRYAKALAATHFSEGNTQDFHLLGDRRVSFKRQLFLELMLVLFGLGGIPLFWCICEYTEKLDDESGEGFHDTPITELLKIFMSIDTGITLVLLLMVYSMRIHRLKLYGYCAKSHYIWNKTSEFWYFFVEACLLSLHVPPGFDFTVTARGGSVCHVNVFSCIVLVRLYLLLRVLRWLSDFNMPEFEFIALINGVDIASNKFTLKVMFQRRRGITMAIISACILGAAVVVAVAFERAMDHSANAHHSGDNIADNYPDAFYMAVITSSSVGFGVLHPSTQFGEAAFTLFSTIGGFVVLTLFMMGAIATCGDQSDDEAIVINTVRHRQWYADMRTACAIFIQSWFRLQVLRNKQRGGSSAAESSSISCNRSLLMPPQFLSDHMATLRFVESRVRLRSLAGRRYKRGVDKMLSRHTEQEMAVKFLVDVQELRTQLDGKTIAGLSLQATVNMEQKYEGGAEMGEFAHRKRGKDDMVLQGLNDVARSIGAITGMNKKLYKAEEYGNHDTGVRSEALIDTFYEIAESQTRVAKMAVEAATLFGVVPTAV